MFPPLSGGRNCFAISSILLYVQRKSVRFQRNVCLLLHLIKPISHSGPKYKLEEKKEEVVVEDTEAAGEAEDTAGENTAAGGNVEETAANPAPEAPPAN